MKKVKSTRTGLRLSGLHACLHACMRFAIVPVSQNYGDDRCNLRWQPLCLCVWQLQLRTNIFYVFVWRGFNAVPARRGHRSMRSFHQQDRGHLHWGHIHHRGHRTLRCMDRQRSRRSGIRNERRRGRRGISGSESSTRRSARNRMRSTRISGLR